MIHKAISNHSMLFVFSTITCQCVAAIERNDLRTESLCHSPHFILCHLMKETVPVR